MATEPQYWSIDRFHGLIQDRSSRQIEGGALVANDVDYGIIGVLRGRRDLKLLWNRDSSVAGLACCGDEIFSTTGSELYNRDTLLKSDWGGWFDWCEINKWYYLVNGSKFIRTDGSSVYEVGITAPASAPSVAVGAAGNLTGDYQYKVTFVDGDGFESNASTASSTVSPSSQKVDLTNIPTGSSDEDVAQRKIYRTTAGGSIFYLLTTITDNTTTTYEDDVVDSNLGATTPPTNHDKPDADFVNITVCRDRWFASKNENRRLYYSLPFPNERGQPSTYYVDMPSYIQGHVALGSVLLVICEDRPYILGGLDDVNSFYYRPLRGSEIYVKSKRVTEAFEHGVITQAGEGLFYIDEVNVRFISKRIRDLLVSPSDVAVGASTPDMYFLVPVESSFSAASGLSVRLVQDDDEATFDSEFGVVVRIESTDDIYEFDNEFGVITTGGSTGASDVLVVDKRQGEFEFSYDRVEASIIEYNNRDRTVYVGNSTGIHSFSSNRVEFEWKSGWSYLGMPYRYKQLTEVLLGYVDGTVILKIYVDGSETVEFDSTSTLLSSDTTVLSSDTTIGVNGETIHDGRAKFQLPSSLWGVSFSVHLTVVGEIHAPIVFKFFPGGVT